MRTTLKLATLHLRSYSSSIFQSGYDVTQNPHRLPRRDLQGFELNDHALKQLDMALSLLLDANGKSPCQSELASRSKPHTLRINTVPAAIISGLGEDAIYVYEPTVMVTYMKVSSDLSSMWSRRRLVGAPFKPFIFG